MTALDPALSEAVVPDDEGLGITRAVFLRALAFVFAVAFLVDFNQAPALIGDDGLLPVRAFLRDLAERAGGRGAGFWADPSLFWVADSSLAFQVVCAVGIAIAVAVMLGATNAVLQLSLWVIQVSLVNVGQLFWGYGWETLLCEAGFLAIFLCPLRTVLPSRASRPPTNVLWLLRWLLFRVMFGAGLIKIRGDTCWRDLTCLAFHYETQPNPNPISFWLAHQPLAFHHLGVLTNHVVELVVPWFLFAPRRLRHAAALIEAGFQVSLILSGNLSFLNWLTLALCIPCFADSALLRLLPLALRGRFENRPRAAPSEVARGVSWAVALGVGALSIAPVANMLSSHQMMNASFNRLHLVNTYGAFGVVGRTRPELTIEGTRDLPGPNAHWVEYAFKCKPGDVLRRPCWISPYHLRLDWQMWFAAMSEVEEEPWLVHLVAKLLVNDPLPLALMDGNPFPKTPPRAIRVQRYTYRFAEPGRADGAWWTRSDPEIFLQPVTLDDPRLRGFLQEQGWGDEVPGS